jgi:hypothetical protein
MQSLAVAYLPIAFIRYDLTLGPAHQQTVMGASALFIEDVRSLLLTPQYKLIPPGDWELKDWVKPVNEAWRTWVGLLSIPAKRTDHDPVVKLLDAAKQRPLDTYTQRVALAILYYLRYCASVKDPDVPDWTDRKDLFDLFFSRALFLDPKHWRNNSAVAGDLTSFLGRNGQTILNEISSQDDAHGPLTDRDIARGLDLLIRRLLADGRLNERIRRPLADYLARFPATAVSTKLALLKATFYEFD